MQFSEFGLDARLLRAVEEQGFTTPTPIQAEAIPPALLGRDLVAAAMTGSGKTAAFLLPILHRILQTPKPGTRLLILTPTRELCVQIREVCRNLTAYAGVGSAPIYGGVGMEPQEEAIRKGVPVIIATPGRLLDHLSRPYGNLDDLEFLVLDEADRMLDMGFLADVRRILARLPRTRQTLLFSATLPGEIRALCREILVDPVSINVERRATPATGVTQSVFAVHAAGKNPLLVALLETNVLGNAIVFTRTRARCNRLADYLDQQGVSNARIHGERTQGQRAQAMADFKAGKVRVLCATDVVARGIDVEALNAVVNYDVPHVVGDYVHRVGRTARAEMVGEAFTFVSPEEEEDLRAIERAIGAKLPRRPLPAIEFTPRSKAKKAAEPRKEDERTLSQRRAAKSGKKKSPEVTTWGPSKGGKGR